MQNQNQNFDAVMFEGRLIAALNIEELAALSERCERYVAECERRGIEMKPDNREVCQAAYYFIDKLSQPAAPDPAQPGDAISTAFTEFSLLRRQLIALGYTAPPIVGTPPAREIRRVCGVLRAALKAHTPLPGEDDGMTQRIRNDSRVAIEAAIAEINAGSENPRPF